MNSMSAAEVSILIKARDEASAVAGKVKATFNELGSTMGTAVKVGALAAGAGIVGIGFALKGFVQDAMESQKIMAQTNAVLTSTKGAAGLSADAISDLAGNLSKVIPIDDEVIQSAENMLLTFTNIGKDVFPQATETVLDMATALGEDTQQAAVQLGKALNDPIAGVTALRKVGVALTDAQRDQIKVLVESGDVMGAQKIILGELATEFGKSGRAAGETMAGKMKILQTQIGNLKEGIGMALLPVLTKLADLAIKYVVPALEDIVQAGSDFANLISASLSGDVAKAGELFNKLPGPLQQVALWLGENKDAIQDLVLGFAEFMKTIGEIALDVLIDSLSGWKDIMVAVAPKLKELGQFIAEHKPLLIAVAAAVGVLVLALIGIPAAIALVVVGIGLLAAHWDQIKAKTLEVWGSIANFVNEKLGFLVLIATFYFEAIQNVVTTAFKVVRDIFKIAMALVHGDWGEAWDGIRQLAIDVWDGIRTDIALKLGLVRDVIVYGFGVVLGWMRDLGPKMLDAIGDLGSLLTDVGKQIVNGLWDGLKSKWEDVKGWFAGLGGDIAGWAKDTFKINSPSLIMVPIGEGIVEGIQRGIENKQSDLLATLWVMSNSIQRAVDQANAAMAMSPVDQNTAAGVWAGMTPGQVAVFTPAEKHWINGVARGKGEPDPFPGYQEGTAFVPQTGLALLHRGERVITAEDNARGDLAGNVAYVTQNLYGDVPEAQAQRHYNELERMLADQFGMDIYSGPRLPLGVYGSR